MTPRRPRIFPIRLARLPSCISFHSPQPAPGRPSAFWNWEAATSWRTCRNTFLLQAPASPPLFPFWWIMGKMRQRIRTAPMAKIAVYFAPNTSQGFQDALTTAIHDATNKPSVISISWGSAESTWTAQAMTAFDSAAQDAAALGITICAACGDNGSSDGVNDGANHVDFPASSPHILACGGTSLQSTDGEITSETVWNDGAKGGAGGGGYSNQFPLPAWQASANIQPPAGGGRGVPDVSGNADPNTGYNILVDGQSLVIGGTSAVAPLWSALIALLNEKLGQPLGFLQPVIYGLPKTTNAFQDITSGTNGSFSAGPGWDAATGLGSPSGQNLLQALSDKVE